MVRASASVVLIGMKASAIDSVNKVSAHRGDGAVHALGIDVEMSDEAQAIQARRQDAARLEVRHQPGRALALQVGEEDVGLRGLDRQAGQPLEALGKARRERVVLREPLDVVVGAYSAAAATTPAWRMPPPTILRPRCAAAMNSFEPTSAEPTGAPSPFEKQTETLSNGAASSLAGTPSLTAA